LASALDSQLWQRFSTSSPRRRLGTRFPFPNQMGVSDPLAPRRHGGKLSWIARRLVAAVASRQSAGPSITRRAASSKRLSRWSALASSSCSASLSFACSSCSSSSANSTLRARICGRSSANACYMRKVAFWLALVGAVLGLLSLIIMGGGWQNACAYDNNGGVCQTTTFGVTTNSAGGTSITTTWGFGSGYWAALVGVVLSIIAAILLYMAAIPPLAAASPPGPVPGSPGTVVVVQQSPQVGTQQQVVYMQPQTQAQPVYVHPEVQVQIQAQPGVAVVYCGQCGTPGTAADAFCGKCGAKIVVGV